MEWHNSLILFSYLIRSLINNDWRKAVDDSSACEHLLTHKSIGGGILQIKILQTLEEKKTLCYPLSFILHNTKPIGHQVILMFL